MQAIIYTNMTKNKCPWLIIGSTGTRNIPCFREYCWIHNARLKVSPGTKPSKKCGKGTKNKYMIYRSQGYESTYSKEWNRYERAIKKEFLRMSGVEYGLTVLWCRDWRL